MCLMVQSYLHSHTGLSFCVMIIQVGTGNKDEITKLLSVLSPSWSPSVALAGNPWDCRSCNCSRLTPHVKKKDIGLASGGIGEHLWTSIVSIFNQYWNICLTQTQPASNYRKSKEYLWPQVYLEATATQNIYNLFYFLWHQHNSMPSGHNMCQWQIAAASVWHDRTPSISAMTREKWQHKRLETPQPKGWGCRNTIHDNIFKKFIFHLMSVLEWGPSGFHTYVCACRNIYIHRLFAPL